MLCTDCGSQNRTGARFCTECGAALSAACPQCGAVTQPGEKFCAECGAALSAAAPHAAPASPPEAPPAPATERRLVSVLFADLVGFTTLSEARDPEDVRELLSRYFETCRSLIERYGGAVEKFIGDAVMAVWGTPVATEDDAERAVRTALDLVEAVAALGAEIGAPELRARAGVATGEAAVNLAAEGQGMVAGDLVNTASRIQSAAEPGAVLVGEATFHAARGAIAFAEAGSLSLKGKAEPVAAWRGLRVIAQRKGVGRTEGVEPPFVGREEELRLVKDLLHATARERRARLVSVTGVAGIGKSRLALEFLHYVDGLAETIYWHQGRSPAYGEGITFWALGEMVRMRARIAESEDPASSLAKLSAAVAEVVPDPEERRWVEPRLAHLLGLAEAPPGEREELYSAWRTFFERISDRGPVVMVFEDLQWADPGLVEFVESILEWSRAHPILVITLARPELVERRPTWGAGQRSFTSLHLEPLAEPAMRTLLAGLVPGMPAEALERILSRAEGVPLYAVETVRMLADRGSLVARGGSYEVSGTLGDLEVPDTLHALIASRLDALEPEERSLLQDAAVLGASFTLAGLAAVTGADPPALEAHLRDLVRKEMLTLDADPRSPERGQYGFVQGLIREVAYGILARADRRARHLAAAHHFESLADEELAGVVAAHYVEAYRASPPGPEAEAVAARARDWLSQAGERALSLGSPEQALTFLDQALEVTAEGPERAALLERAGESADRAGSYERAVALFEEAIAFHQAAGDADAAGIATARLGRSLGLGLNRFSETIERAERALAALGEQGGKRAGAELAITLSLAQTNAGSPEAALERAEQALPVAERLDDADLLGRAIGARAHALFDLGRHREAAMLTRGQIGLAEASGSLLEQAHGLLLLSVFVQDESPREALAAALEAADRARRGGDRGLETLNLLNGAELGVFLGDWDDARGSLAETGQRELRRSDRSWLEVLEAMLAALTGDVQGASETLARVQAEVGATEFVASRTTYLRARALVDLAGGNLEQAHRAAAEAVAEDPAGINSAIALAIQARAALWLGDAETARQALSGMEGFRGRWMATARETVGAGLAALEGRAQEAAGAYRRAIDGWRALEVPLDLALCELDMVTLLGRDHPDAAAAAREARQILERLGAGPFLQRLGPLPSVENVGA